MSSPNSLLLPLKGPDCPTGMVVLVTPCAGAPSGTAAARMKKQIVDIRMAPSSSSAGGAATALFQKFTLPSDHRQIDVLRAAVAGRRERDVEAAQVHAVHALERGDELLPGQVPARTLQALDHDVGHDEALQAGEVVVGVARLLEHML